MTEIFYDETNGILRDMRKRLMENKEKASYNQELVQAIFRGVHTLKADSAMMLYENLARLSKQLEGLLYCFRGDGKKITDTNRFSQIVFRYLDFLETEIDKLSVGKTPDGSAVELEQDIRRYTLEITTRMQKDEAKEYKEKVEQPKRQVYYISSAPDEKSVEEKPDVVKKAAALTYISDANPLKKDKKKQTADDTEYRNDVALSRVKEQTDTAFGTKKKYMISDAEREKIRQSSSSLLRIIDEMEYEIGDKQTGYFTREQLVKLQKIQENILWVKNRLTNTNFVPVAKKMEVVVDEMSMKLGKPAKLVVRGEDTVVDLEKREKISGALIHIIRNAIDHGIEDLDTRERYGKAPMGLVKLRFSTEDGQLKVSVKDDGAGIDSEKILERAQSLNMLTKEAEAYTEKEIMNLILLNGMTTTQEVNEYSGRGVGMDVINHNVKELGGKLRISSKLGVGTTITMKF